MVGRMPEQTEAPIPPPDVLRYYERGGERDRLTEGRGRLEFLRTQDILRRHLPPAPARVLDVGGGMGVHAEWLAADGYAVHLVDPVPSHVEAAGRLPGVTAELGDARSLLLQDGSFDAVLMLGPLYHLTDRADRVRAFAEAGRVVRPGGLVAGAAISRFASMHDILRLGVEGDPRIARAVEIDVATGQHRNPVEDNWFFTTAYFHLPDDLAAEAVDAGLDLDGVLAIEGVPTFIATIDETVEDPARLAVLMRWLTTVEREPSLLGGSSHLMVLARRR